MTTHRIDYEDTDIGFVHAETAVKHEPIIRPDRHCSGHLCNQGRGPACKTGCVPLKQPRIQVDYKPRAADVIHRADVQQASRLLSAANIIRAIMAWLATLALIMMTFAFAGYLMARDAHAADAETTATIAAGADTVSTVVAVGSGAAVESNGLIADPGLFVVASAAKIAAPRFTRDMAPEDRKTALQWMAGIWSTAAGNNVVVTVAAKVFGTAISAPVSLAIGSVYGVYQYIKAGEQCDQEEAERVAKLRAAEQVAMVQQ